MSSIVDRRNRPVAPGAAGPQTQRRIGFLVVAATAAVVLAGGVVVATVLRHHPAPQPTGTGQRVPVVALAADGCPAQTVPMPHLATGSAPFVPAGGVASVALCEQVSQSQAVTSGQVEGQELLAPRVLNTDASELVRALDTLAPMPPGPCPAVGAVADLSLVCITG